LDVADNDVNVHSKTNGGYHVQKPRYDHCRARDLVTGIAGIRSRPSRIIDERAIEVQQCGQNREPESSPESAGANSRFQDYGILFFFGEKLRAKALR
jgi:hypothetical protein